MKRWELANKNVDYMFAKDVLCQKVQSFDPKAQRKESKQQVRLKRIFA